MNRLQQTQMLHKYRRQLRNLLPLLLLLAINTLLVRASYVSMTVGANTTTINTPATYSFQINRGYDPVNFAILNPTAVPLNTVIIITFPSQFITLTQTPTLPCYNTDNGQSLTCNANAASRQITITNYYSSGATLSNKNLNIDVQNVINAYIAGTSGNFYWQIVNANGSVIDQGPSAASDIQMTGILFTASIFQSCIATVNGALVGSYSPLTLNLVPSNSISSLGQLILLIPLAWTSDPLGTATLQNSPTCTGIANTTGTVTCSYSSQVITISGLTTGSLSSPFSVMISNILVPPTVNSGQTISVYSQWPNGIQIDTCTTTIVGATAAAFQTPSTTFTSSDNITVQSSFTGRLKLTLSRPFYYQDSIVLTLPSEFTSAQVSSANFANFVSTPSLNTLTLSSFPSTTTTITSGSVLSFTLTSLTNPLSTVPINLMISIYRNNQLYQQSTLTYSAVATSITSFSIQASSKFVYNSGIATFTIKSELTLPPGSRITITYPNTMTVANTATMNILSGSLNGTMVANGSYQVNNNQIIFSNIFTTAFAGTTLLSINDFINPSTVQPSTYLIVVADSAGYTIMTGSQIFTASTKALLSNSVSASSLKVLDTGVTYTINITSNYAFTSVSILIPSDITIGSYYSSTCAPNDFSSCNLSGNNLTFVGTLPAGSYSLNWGYNTNPNSLQSTASFLVYTYQQGWGVQNSQGVINLAMTTTDSFNSFILYPSSHINYAPISINMALSLPNNSPNGQISITFPAELTITTATCAGCTVVPPFIYLAIAANTTNVSLIISNINNVGSFKPVSSFTASLTSGAGFGSLLSTAPGWTNDVHSSFTTFVSGGTNFRGQSNNFQFQVTGLSSTQSYVQVTIPSSFGALSVAPTGATLLSSSKVQLPCTGTSCTFNFSLINPTSQLNSTFLFSLTSFTSDEYQVGLSTSNSWTFDCQNTNCRSCLANSSCLSCYGSTLSTFYFLNTTSSQCIRTCSAGYFFVNQLCNACDSNCSECSNTSRNCTVCPATYFLENTRNLCVPSCLTGYFANSLGYTCDICAVPCATCSGTSTYCLSCILNYYLLSYSCLSNCTPAYFINNPVTRNCDPCSSNCLTCVNQTTICLTCNNSLSLYFQNNVCVSICSSNYFLVDNVCTYCMPPCRLCTGAVNVCASCFSNSSTPIYYNQYCIIALNCPVGHYVNSTNSSCEICPTNCTQCTSPTNCSVCSSNYYLFGLSCLPTCPNTTFTSSNSTTNLCQTCNNCNTCSSSSNCTSCVLSKYLYTGICYATCPNGSFASGSVCSICITNCPTCQNYTYCSSCIPSMNLYQGTCYSDCPLATYANTTQKICIACPPSCATCVSSSSCQTCIASYSLENSQCVLTCSQGVSFNQTCLACGLHCSICTTPPCSLCDPSYYFYNNVCSSQCPTNMLSLDNMACVLCTMKFINCSTCTLAQCLTCTYGLLANGTCHPCPVGTYTESSVCTTCPSTCTACLNQTYCYSCATNNYMLNNMCASVCPQNMFINGTVCSICTDGCSICNATTTICSICRPGIYLYNNLCNSACPSPLVVSYDFLTCVTEAVYYQQFSKASKIIPFPFTIALGVIVILGLLLKWFFKKMHLRTVLCGLVSFIELASWLIFLIFQYRYYSNYHALALYGVICSGVGIVLLYLLNMLHLRFYYKYISEDMQFVRWQKKFCSSNITMLIFSTSFTFKFYRFIHSKFLGRDNLSMVLSSSNRLVPFSLLGVLSIFLCSAPLLTGCALSLYNSISQDQQFFIALDTAVVTGIVILLMLMDLHHPPDYFIQQHETQNMRKKAYVEDEIKFDRHSDDNPLEENASNQNLLHVQEDMGEMSLPSSANKLQSTFLKTRQHQQHDKNHSLEELGSLTNIKPVEDEDENIEDIDQSEESDIDRNAKAKWMPKTYDHHGYLIKYDANNNPVKYDENGYRIEIDEEGVHHRYNQLGQEMVQVNGQYLPIDENGYRLKNGKRYDERGYEVRQYNQGIAFYQSHGFRVIQDGDKQRLVDQDGNTVVIDEDGTIHRYQQDGLQVVEYKGQLLLMDKDGNYVKKDKNGNWRAYDPQDGFYLKKNAINGQIQKYDELGFRVVRDKFGNMHRYDEDGYHVTVLPGGIIVRHDDSGYRIEKDEHGNIHRYDKDGFEVVTDQNGNIKFIDSNGYTVQRDLYGRISLYDQNGYLVVIDEETGRHRRFNEEGLEVFTDIHGNITLKDKRGRIVKELEGDTYQKYDEQGNKIYLDENGYEVQEDSDENIVRYDKVGDLVQPSFDIRQDDDEYFQSTLMGGNQRSKLLKYKYKPPRQQINHEQQLNQLMSNNELFIYDEEQSQISQLKEFHDDVEPVQQVEVEEELTKIVNRQRDQLMFFEETDAFEEVQNFEVIKNSCYDQIAQPPNEGLAGLEAIAENEEGGLADKELNKQAQFDNQLIMAEDGVDAPDIGQVGIESIHRSLVNRQLNNQPEFDKEALVRQIDDNEPDVLAIKKRNEQMTARQNALQQSLLAPADQEQIEIKSVADISINERSFDNQGVQPMENRTEYDQINSLDEMMDLPMGRNKRGGRSEMSFVNARKDTQTVYNYNTVQVQIKNNHQNLYDQDEQIESLHEEEWQEQLNPMQFARKQKVKNEGHSSNANTNILYVEDDQDNKDTLSEFVNNTESGSKLKAHRYQNHDILSGNRQSIEEVQQQLFEQMNTRGVRERREFKLSGAPNPLVQYAKNIEAHKKSLQQKMYLDQIYK